MRLNVRALDRRIVEIVKVIDHGDSPIAFGQQAIDQMRTDESRAAGN
jgi:hypothetical protein